MKVSLRLQFLLPMLLAVLATAVGVTFCSKWFADGIARDATLERLSSTAKLCVNAPYPLTDSVLTQIQELSALTLGVAEVRDSADTMVRLESKSSEFPLSENRKWIVQLVDNSVSKSQLPFETFEFEGGIRANAKAFRLPQGDSTRSSRYLILLEPQLRSQTTSVQAFVLPLVTGVFSSVAIAVVAAFVAARIGKRVERLGKHVQKIAEGSFETIATSGPIDAIHGLYDSVNSMSEQLKKSAAQMAQNERSRMINLMASGLAHELRNHLTGARLAIQTCSPDPSTQEAMSIALMQLKLAEESIQRLLALRVDATEQLGESMTIQQIHESVRGLVQPIASHQRVSFRMNDFDGSSTGPSETPSDGKMDALIEDGSSIVGALISLILNAFEAAGPGGEVNVSVRRADDPLRTPDLGTTEWVVQDNGPGPTEAMALVMFEPFATSKREGVGLGLAMAKRIANRHNGDVYWNRRAPWTIFTLKIANRFGSLSDPTK